MNSLPVLIYSFSYVLTYSGQDKKVPILNPMPHVYSFRSPKYLTLRIFLGSSLCQWINIILINGLVLLGRMPQSESVLIEIRITRGPFY